MEQDNPQSQEVPVDEEYKKTTGYNSVQEHIAYQDGYSNSQQLMLKWVEKWDGGTNSALGQLLAKKMKELSSLVPDTTTVEEKAREYIGEQRSNEDLDNYCSRISAYIAGYKEAQQDSGRRWTDADAVKMMEELLYDVNRETGSKTGGLSTYHSMAKLWLQEYKNQQQKP